MNFLAMFRCFAALGFGAIISVTSQVGEAQAGALSDSPAVSQDIQFGSCTLQKRITVSPSSASMSISDGGFRYYVGGTEWSGNVAGTSIGYSGNSGLTAAQIATCLGIAEADVTGISQNGADGTFADDEGFFLEFSTSASASVAGVVRPFGTFRFNMPGTDTFTASTNTAKPVANAGPDQTNKAVGSTVQLSGSGTDVDAGTTLTYAWSYVSGEQVVLSDTTAANPTFTVPGIYGNPLNFSTTLRLIVSDGTLSSVADTVTINYGFEFGPLYSAGNINEDVTFGRCTFSKSSNITNGTASLVLKKNGLTLYAGRSAFTGYSGQPTYFSNVADFYNKGIYGSDLAECLSLTGFYDVLNVLESGPVLYDNYYTHPGFSISFDVQKPAFGRQAGTYTFNMPGGNTYPAATVTAPTANAGPDQLTVASGATVTLNGSGSRDPDADTTLTYAWTQTSGTPALTLSSSSAVQPTFTAPTLLRSDTAKTFVFQLAVSDGGQPVSDSVTITVLPPAKLEQTVSFTNPGNQNFVANSTLALTASSATPTATGNDPVPSTSLELTSNSTSICSVSGTQLSMVAIGTCSITASKLGDANYLDATPVTHTFRLLGVNNKPVAVVGADQSGQHIPYDYVYLDGSGSSDPDGDTITYAWSQKSGPTIVTLYNSTTAGPTFSPPAVALGAPDDVYVFELVVKDEFNLASDPKTVTITIQTPPKRDQRIFLTNEPNANSTVGQTWTPAAYAVYDVQTGNLLESFPSNLPVTISIGSQSGICSQTNGVIRFDGVGVCNVSFTQAGNGSYNPTQGNYGRSITVGPAPAVPVISGSMNFAANEDGVGNFTVSGGTPLASASNPYTYGPLQSCQGNGQLPPGMTLTPNSSGFTINQSANVYLSGQYCFAVAVTDANGPTILSTNFTVTAAIAYAASMTPADGTNKAVKVGEAYNQTIAATLSPNNGFAVVYSLKSGALPAGAAFDTATGVISGNATTVSTGSYVVLATFSKTVGGALQTYTVEKTYNFTISPSAVISLVNTAPVAGTVGQAYSHDFDASGDAAGSYRFFIGASDVLPDGLSLNATTGVLSGVPTRAASFTFLLTAEQTTDVQNFGSTQITLVVNAAPVVIAPVVTAAVVEATKEIAAITEQATQSVASTSSGIMGDTVGDAIGDSLSDSPGSSPLVAYQDGAMIIVSKAKMTPAVKAMDELVVADRKAMRLRSGGSVPGLFHAYGDGEGSLAADLVDPARWSFWGSIRGSRLSTSAAYNSLEGNQYNLMGGASYRMSPQMVVGGFGGYETFSYADNVGAKLTGNGFTAGAYVGYRPANGLRFEGQVSSTWIDYGVSSGTVTGSFDANRIVASAAIVGSHSAAGFLFEPSLRVSGTWEEQSAYVNSAGLAQAASSFSSSKVSTGLKVSKSFDLAGGAKITPFAGIYADYNTSNGTTKGAFDDLSARAALGFNATLNQNVTFGLNGDISGLGLNDVLLMSLKAQLGIAF